MNEIQFCPLRGTIVLLYENFSPRLASGGFVNVLRGHTKHSSIPLSLISLYKSIRLSPVHTDKRNR